MFYTVNVSVEYFKKSKQENTMENSKGLGNLQLANFPLEKPLWQCPRKTITYLWDLREAIQILKAPFQHL